MDALITLLADYQGLVGVVVGSVLTYMLGSRARGDGISASLFQAQLAAFREISPALWDFLEYVGRHEATLLNEEPTSLSSHVMPAASRKQKRALRLQRLIHKHEAVLPAEARNALLEMFRVGGFEVGSAWPLTHAELDKINARLEDAALRYLRAVRKRLGPGSARIDRLLSAPVSRELDREIARSARRGRGRVK